MLPDNSGIRAPFRLSYACKLCFIKLACTANPQSFHSFRVASIENRERRGHHVFRCGLDATSRIVVSGSKKVTFFLIFFFEH